MSDEAHFIDLIHKIATEHNFDKYELDVKHILSGGTNYTSKLYNVTISEGSNVLHLFAKVAAIGEKMRTQAPKVYEKEQYGYTELVKTYEKIQNEHKVPEEHKLTFPKFYGCNPNLFEETVVLENLEMKGYSVYDRFKSIDWPYASTAVGELAKMHAISFAHAKYYPDDFNKVMEEFMFDWNMDDDDMRSFMANLISHAGTIVVPKNNDKFVGYFENTFVSPEHFTAVVKSTQRTVLNHGDYRTNNLMYKYLDDGKMDIKIVDLQTLQGGSPVTDLIYFIFTGSDEEFRAEYYDKLLDHYYTELSAAMKRLKVDPESTFSREDFDFEMKEKLPFGLTLAVFTLPVVTVDIENAPDINDELDISNLGKVKTSDLYAERLNGVVNDFVKWGILK